MEVTSYGKCPHCGKHEMLVGFWYNGESLTPDYLCPECFKEFGDAMVESAWWTMHGRGLEDPDWDADAALERCRVALLMNTQQRRRTNEMVQADERGFR